MRKSTPLRRIDQPYNPNSSGDIFISTTGIGGDHTHAFTDITGDLPWTRIDFAGSDLDDISGTLPWAKVSKSGATLLDIPSRAHSQLTSLTADDHANYVHVSNARTISARHTFNPPTTNSPFIIGANAAAQLVSGLNAQYVGGQLESVFMRKDANSDLDMNGFVITGDDGDTLHHFGRAAVGYMGSISDAAGFAHRDRTAIGDLALLQLGTGRTFLQATAGQNITFRVDNTNVMVMDDAALEMEPSTTLRSNSYASQTTGWGVTYAGAADFRYVYTDELHAKAFIADLEQALAGGQIISKSVATLSRDFTAPAAGGTTTLYVNDLPSAENMAVFESGDIIRLREFSRSGGSLSITNCWGVVTSYSNLAGKEQSWTFTRSSGGNAGAMSTSTVVAKDSIVLDYGTTGNGFYEVNAIDGLYAANSPYSQIVTWTGHPVTGLTVMVRTGNLTGLGFSGEYGMYARGVAGQYLKASGSGLELRNVDLEMYNGSDQTVDLAANNGSLKLGTNIGATSSTTLDFDGATGAIRFGPQDTGKANWYWDSTTLHGRVNTSSYILLGSSGMILQDSAGTPRITLDSSGNSYFSGVMTVASAGEIRQGTGTPGTDFVGLRIRQVSSIGELSLHNGSADPDVILDNLGIDLQGDSSSDNVISRNVCWWEDITDRSGNPIAKMRVRNNGVFDSKDLVISARGTTADPNSFVYLQALDSAGTIGGSLSLNSDGGLTFGGSFVPSTNTPSLGANWATHSGDEAIKVRRWGSLVFLSGIIEATGAGATTIVTLPAEFRPAQRQLIYQYTLENGFNTPNRFDINTNGTVTTTGWVPATGDIVAFSATWMITTGF